MNHLVTVPGFQSIGVTKDWRPQLQPALDGGLASGFQSIGVTKDWRRFDFAGADGRPEQMRFPINRRHQGLATLVSIQLLVPSL